LQHCELTAQDRPVTTVGELMLTALDLGDTPMIGYFDGSEPEQRRTYAEFGAQALGIAELIAARAEPHATVAIMGSPAPDWYAAFAGAQIAGCATAPLNPMYSAAELAPILQQLPPALILLGSGIRGDTEAFLRSEYAAVTIDIASLPTEPAQAPSDPRRWHGVAAASDTAVILHTSGTTGMPKAAAQTHANYIAFAQRWGEEVMLPGERVISYLSPVHQAGLLLSFICTVQRRGHLTQLNRFEPELFWSAVRQNSCTWCCLIAPGPARLLASPPSGLDRSHTLRRATGGSTTSDQRVALFERFGIVFTHEQIGSTETTLFAFSGSLQRSTALPPDGLLGPTGTLVGRVVPGWTDVRIAGPDGAARPAGERGEIQARGPGLFTGYVNDPARTAEAFTADGWFRTGDLGFLTPDGELYLVDRVRNMIRRSGENISPNEIERVISVMPDVALVAVYGVPDALRGEEIMASVVPQPGQQVDPAKILEHCRAHLASFKLPRYVELCEQLPMTVSHKVRKEALRTEWQSRPKFDRMANR
jgi:acyl-CoA synthetase (AMP-forming)/AMP-acid ligase II